MNRKQRKSAPRKAPVPSTGAKSSSTLSQADAIAHLQAGRFVEAEAMFQQIIAREPDNWQSRHLLGLTAYRMGKLEEAVAFLQQALEIMPDLAEAHSDLGVVLRDLNRLDEARHACETAIRLKPALHPAYSNLGNVLKSQGDYAGAAEAYRNALAISPDYASAHANLGVVLIHLGQPNEALAACRKGVGLAPNRADMQVALGHVLRHIGNIDEAMAAYLKAIDLNPALASVYSDLGCLLQEKGEWDTAMQAHEKALTMQPDNPKIINNVGVTLKALGRYKEAEQHYRKALAIDPDYADALSNLGAALYSMDRTDEAIAAYRRATELDPRALYAHVNLAAALLELDQMPEAIAMYGKALAIDPEFPAALAENYNLCRQTCNWREVAALEQKLLTRTYSIGKRIAPFQLLNVPCGPEVHLACAREWVKGLVKPVEAPFVHRAGGGGGRIRIGYLSADYYEHATANLITELLERHDRSRFEVAGYCFSRDDGSPMRKRLIAAFDDFVSVSAMSHAEAARRIYADGVDILVDLKGFTSNARTEILTCRPAPIQVNYLGYPGTMGAEFIDYIIGDAFLTPMDQAEFYQEKIVQLPGSYQPNDTKRSIAAEMLSRAECGLPEEGFVYCCFNGPYKITPHQFSVWMQLLRETPGSVLWLLEGNSLARENLAREAEAHGVSASRLVFAPKINLSRHLARHRLADLFLDSSPINAHTTASDALWADLPVLTLAGDTFVSRVAGSLLHAVGLPELVTHTEDDYIATALRLARSPDELTALRERLAHNRPSAQLFNIEVYTANIERAFEHMAEIYESGRAPEAFAVADLGEAKPRVTSSRRTTAAKRAQATSAVEAAVLSAGAQTLASTLSGAEMSVPLLSVPPVEASVSSPAAITSPRIAYETCPLCGSEDFKHFKSADCSQHPCYSPILPPTMNWNRCNACGHVFTEGYFTDEAAAVVFSKTVPHQTAGHNVEVNRIVSARIIERVASHMPSGDWLDVGFGNASLLFTAGEWGFHPVGLDMRKDNVAQLQKLGYEAHCTPIEELDSSGRFSVISMADVLEHIPMPKGALAAAHRLLRPGGVLFLSMPNSETIVWRVLDASGTNPYWPEIEHYHNFSRARLYALLEDTGFSPRAYSVSERYRTCMEVIATKRG